MGGGGGWVSLALCLKIEDSCPNFAKKCPDFLKTCPVCVRLWFKFSYKNAVLRVSFTKNTKISACRVVLLSAVYEIFIEVPIFQDTSPSMKNFWLSAWTVAVNLKEIKKYPQRIIKIKPFINKYNWQGVNVPSEKDDWKKFAKNNVTIALNVLYAK